MRQIFAALTMVAFLGMLTVPGVAAEQDEVAPKLLSSCSANVVSPSAPIACFFECGEQGRVSVSFTGRGTVEGVCSTSAAACAAVGQCSASARTVAATAGIGICLAQGLGLASCGA